MMGYLIERKIRIRSNGLLDNSIFCFFCLFFLFVFFVFFANITNITRPYAGRIATRLPQMVNRFPAFGTMLFHPCHFTGSQFLSVTN